MGQGRSLRTPSRPLLTATNRVEHKHEQKLIGIRFFDGISGSRKVSMIALDAVMEGFLINRESMRVVRKEEEEKKNKNTINFRDLD